MSGYKVVMKVGFTEASVFDMFNFRVRWSEPYAWQDGDDEAARRYELLCWVEQGAEVRTLVRLSVAIWYQGYNEKYRFPDDMDLFVQCKVRPANARGVVGDWRFSNRIRVKDIPIYLPGVEGIDLRGLPAADVLSVIRNTQKEVVRQDQGGLGGEAPPQSPGSPSPAPSDSQTPPS